MKKLLTSVFVCLGVLAFTGCSAPMQDTSKRENELNCPFTSKMTVSLDKLTAEGTIARLGEGRWEAEFETPNTLSGVKLCFEENTVNASYKGLNFSVPKSAIPVKAMLNNLIEAVDTAARAEELQGKENEGLFNISGSLEGGDYTLTLDDEGCIHTFEMPNNLLKIAFTEVKTSDAPQPEVTTEAAEECTTEVQTEVSTKE